MMILLGWWQYNFGEQVDSDVTILLAARLIAPIYDTCYHLFIMETDKTTPKQTDAETQNMAKPSRFSINDILHCENKSQTNSPSLVSLC